MTRRAIKTSTYVMAPLMMGLAFTATAVVELLLTEKWLPCVFFLRVFCITYMFYPIHTANLNAIKALGRSDIFLKLEILKKVVGIVLLFITVNIGVKAMAYSLLLSSVSSQIINSWPNRRLLGYNYLEQLKDILPNIILAVVMGVIVYCINFIGLAPIITLLIQVPLGLVIYLIGSIITKNDSFYYLLKIISPVLNKLRKRG
jgi:O-antigen/teichoic acid export membrane protein